MNLNDFQLQALKSVAITDKTIAALAHRTLGLTGEAGIIGNAVKKTIRDGGGALKRNRRQAFGGEAWRRAVLCGRTC